MISMQQTNILDLECFYKSQKKSNANRYINHRDVTTQQHHRSQIPTWMRECNPHPFAKLHYQLYEEKSRMNKRIEWVLSIQHTSTGDWSGLIISIDQQQDASNAPNYSSRECGQLRTLWFYSTQIIKSNQKDMNRFGGQRTRRICSGP